MASRESVAAPREWGKKMGTERMYDLVVIEGGPAGYAAAIRAGQLDKKVACIEEIAYYRGLIDRIQLTELIKSMPESLYKGYLEKILKED